MRALAVQFDAVVTVILGSLDDLLEAQGRTIIPDPGVSHGVETDLHHDAP